MSDWSALVNGVRAGDQGAEVQLYRAVCAISNHRSFKALANKVPEGGDDAIHDTYLVMLRALRRGALADTPNAFSAYVRTVNRRLIRDVALRRDKAEFAQVHVNIRDNRESANPERACYQAERLAILAEWQRARVRGASAS